MKTRIIKVMLSAVLFCAVSMFFTPVYGQTQDSKNSDDWQFIGNIYLWTTELGGQAANGAEVDISFSDILENLRFSFMGGLGAKKGKWSFMTDVIYVDLADDPNIAFGPPPWA